MPNRLKILFLPRWYPNRFDPMPGLFFRRQAEALVDSCEVAVLSVHPGKEVPNRYELDMAWENGVFAVRVYYRIPEKKIPVIGNILKMYRFYKANSLGLRMLGSFEADIVHVHVLTRSGIIAMINKFRTKTPYIVSEHWSRYFSGTNSYRGWLRKMMTRLVVKRAGALIAVSVKLKEAMQSNQLDNPHFTIIPNLVEVGKFIPSVNPILPDTRRIIHISCFDDQSKNITGFFNAIKKVTETRSDFVCFMIGEGPDLEKCKSLASALGLSDVVIFKGLQVDNELVSLLNTSDFLVQSSNYETFGTVVIESLACGIPVVSTSVGIAPEIIHGGNGITVPPGDVDEMASAILTMLGNCRQYDHNKIREEVVLKYSSAAVAVSLIETYQTVLGIEK